MSELRESASAWPERGSAGQVSGSMVWQVRGSPGLSENGSDRGQFSEPLAFYFHDTDR